MLHIFHTYVACVLFGCLYMVAMIFKCFLGVFTSVSEVCFKCFNCFQTYVATVVFRCFKIDRVLHFSSLIFYCIVSPGAVRASIRRRGRVLPNRRRRTLFPSCRSDSTAPHGSRNGVKHAGVRPDARTPEYGLVSDAHLTVNRCSPTVVF
jgi:hypothetical protein